MFKFLYTTTQPDLKLPKSHSRHSGVGPDLVCVDFFYILNYKIWSSTFKKKKKNELRTKKVI